MSDREPVGRKQVQLALQSKAKEAVDAYNTANSVNYPLKYENVALSAADQTLIDNGSPYIRFTVTYGTTVVPLNTLDESDHPGVAIARILTKRGAGTLLAIDISDYIVNHFDNIHYVNNSLRVNRVAAGVEGKVDGEHWTEKVYIYFEYTTKGINNG